MGAYKKKKILGKSSEVALNPYPTWDCFELGTQKKVENRKFLNKINQYL